jgi:hypothetical protein
MLDMPIHFENFSQVNDHQKLIYRTKILTRKCDNEMTGSRPISLRRRAQKRQADKECKMQFHLPQW